AVVQERRAALRREIAATGFGDLPAHALEALAPLLQPGRRMRVPRWVWPAALVPLAATTAAAVLAIAHRDPAAVGVLLAALAAAAVLALGWRQATTGERTAREHRLLSLRSSGIGSADWHRLAERLPSLRALPAA